VIETRLGMRAAVVIFVFCVGILLALGMVMLYSSTMTQHGERQLLMQLVWCALGLVVCAIAARTDYRRLKPFWWVFLGLGVLMLAAVLVPHIGVVKGNARRWFGFHGLSFQPSEFGKVACLVWLAWYGERFQRQMASWYRGVLIPAAGIGLFVGLIFKEPDVGNALVLASVCAIVLLLAGMRLWYFLPPVLVGVVAVGWFISHNQMRLERIHSWLHVEETKQDKGLQAYQAMVALGSGGWTGRGLGDSREKLGYLPEHQTDFIFAIIGEELGLGVTLGVVVAFLAIMICGLIIAWNSADTFGFLLGSGITFLIGLQAVINIGVVTSALPNKGLPLPFISRGGSNLFILLACVGLVLSIARHAPAAELIEESDEAEDALSQERENPFRAPQALEPARGAAFQPVASGLWAPD